MIPTPKTIRLSDSARANLNAIASKKHNGDLSAALEQALASYLDLDEPDPDETDPKPEDASDDAELRAQLLSSNPLKAWAIEGTKAKSRKSTDDSNG